MDILTVLSWASIAAGLAAFAVYFIVLLRRPRWIRLLNGSALFFTGIALTQLPLFLRDGAEGRAWLNGVVAVGCLLLAVLVQSLAALRDRKSWDGADRRQRPEWNGADRRGTSE